MPDSKTPDDLPTTPQVAPEPVLPPPAAADTTPSPLEELPASGSTWRRRAGLAGAASGLVAIGGLGGFALGHATSDGRGDRFEPTSFHPGDGDQGYGPGQGVPPGGFDDHHGDGFGPDGTQDDTQSDGTHT